MCGFWPWIHDTLEPTEVGFHLAHASELEAIAKAETKTDSVDARLLARMLAAKLIPEMYPKPASQREILHLVRHRTALVTMVDPIRYRDHFTMPRLMVIGTNDPYWPLDALNLYWDQPPDLSAGGSRRSSPRRPTTRLRR